MLKILQASLQQYVNREIQDVEAGFRKGSGTKDQFANIRWIIIKAKSSRKTSTSALLTTPNPLTVWITTVEINNSKSEYFFHLIHPSIILPKNYFVWGYNAYIYSA